MFKFFRKRGRIPEIIILGLFPTTYSNAAACCGFDYFHSSELDLKEYSAEMLDEQGFISSLVWELGRDSAAGSG